VLNTVTLVVILLVPLVILGSIAMVAAFAFALRTHSATGKPKGEPSPPDRCPSCGHKHVEVLNYCAKCGASIRPLTPEM